MIDDNAHPDPRHVSPTRLVPADINNGDWTSQHGPQHGHKTDVKFSQSKQKPLVRNTLNISLTRDPYQILSSIDKS